MMCLLRANAFDMIIILFLMICRSHAFQDFRLPRDCSDLLIHRPLAADGEYWLNVTQYNQTGGVEYVTARIYCHNMASCAPEEYLTLVAPPGYNYAYAERERLDGNPTDACNTPGLGSMEYKDYGHTQYRKLKIKLPLEVDIFNQTFADTLTGTRVPYGRAHACYSWYRQVDKGTFSINITGTGLKLHPVVAWLPWPAADPTTVISVNILAGRQNVQASCGGYAGGCQLLVPFYLQKYGPDVIDVRSAIEEWIPVHDVYRAATFKLSGTSTDRSTRLRCVAQCMDDVTCTSTQYDDVSKTCSISRCDDMPLAMQKVTFG